MEISKDLLSEIYGKEDISDISLIELAILAKDWAWREHRYRLTSGFPKKIKRPYTEEEIAEIAKEVFKDCQWILDIKGPSNGD